MTPPDRTSVHIGHADIAEAAVLAADRIRPIARHTPVELLSEPGAAPEIWGKCENFQTTGSFKIRGAANAVAMATERGIRSVLTASTGNHGAAVARSAHAMGVAATVYAPEHAASGKIAAIARWGATVIQVPGDPINAERAAREAATPSQPYVSPYNDPDVVAGQATIGLELLADLPDLATVVVSVGGGGLIGGIASVLKAYNPTIQVVGASAHNSAVMHHSVAAGSVLEMDSQHTLSDGTAGGVEHGALTFPLCRDLVDRWITVTEDDIAATVANHIRTHHQLIEGSAGVAIAAADRLVVDGIVEGPVAVVICGANIDPDVAARLVA